MKGAAFGLSGAATSMRELAASTASTPEESVEQLDSLTDLGLVSVDPQVDTSVFGWEDLERTVIFHLH